MGRSRGLRWAALLAWAGAHAVHSDDASPALGYLPTIFVYDMPAEFNEDVARTALSSGAESWFPTLQHLDNYGMGPRLDAQSFDTHPYMLEYVLWQRVVHHYPHRTRDPAQADLFWIPFLPALSAMAARARVPPDTATQPEVLRSEEQAVNWLKANAPYFLEAPERHVLVVGKCAAEFFGDTRALFGSALFQLPELARVQAVSFERDPGKQAVCIPPDSQYKISIADDIFLGLKRSAEALTYPKLAESLRTEHTPLCFWREGGVDGGPNISGTPYLPVIAYSSTLGPSPWQVTRSRPNLATFVGNSAARGPAKVSVLHRDNAAKSCLQWQHKTRPCVVHSNTSRLNIRAAYTEAIFSLQPPGDTATRSGIFDSLVSGCIPVVWGRHTLDGQYAFHLPEPWALVLLVPEEHEEDVLPWLHAWSSANAESVRRMQEAIARAGHRFQYSSEGGRPSDWPEGKPFDAFEHLVVGLGAAASGEAAAGEGHHR